ncbi:MULTISPECIES: M50 family metallopeptidase [Shewanella]|nr:MULTISPECIES: M50 family metallopeptidase [Shewanella]MBO1271346.1 M50 family metallopeptidase [Shewanella sp. 4t3-1-2LB]MCL2905410.1 M50 family metallopeptidase [Shewanella fodinae]GGY90842.1 membrane zinc metalloprotease [Shewanella fodinae]
MLDVRTVPSSPSLIPGKAQFFVELILALVLSRLPYVSLPFHWLESYFHELSHAIAAVISGGVVSQIRLFPDGSGLCFSQGGWPVLVGFSGYTGAALWGTLLFFMSCLRQGIRQSYLALGLVVLLTLALWGRDLLSIAIMLSLSVLFLLPLKLTYSTLLRGSLRLVAMIVMLNALASPAVLLGLGQRGDAALLAQMTLIPAVIWVALWFAVGLGALYLCWRVVANQSAKAKGVARTLDSGRK